MSSDIITEFRDKGDEVRILPLSFKEFYDAYQGDKHEAWNDYILYDGMPAILSNKDDILDSIINILSSSVGSLTTPQKIYNTFISNRIKDLSKNTIVSYLDYLLDSFLIEKAERYDIKGKKYISTPQKYYFVDIGIRNARLNFRQVEENHIMENIIYNEILIRGYNVAVGVVDVREGNLHKQLEVDFVCNQGNKRYYVQVALNIDTREKNVQESRPLNNIGDNFKKIIVVKDNLISGYFVSVT